jgi:uncharacterized protein (TIGR02300 family)
LTAGQRGAKSSAVFQTIVKDTQVAKPELGTKRLCGSCGAKFYDLSKDPIVCPKCETVFHPVVYTSTRGRPAEAARQPTLVPEAAEAPEAADVELVSLEDADAESGGGTKKVAAADVDADEDEVEVADDGAEDDTFLETEDDEGDDVSDIVGGDREDEEDP